MFNESSLKYKAFWAELAKGKFINHEFKRLHKNGNDIWLRGIYNPMLDMNGNPVRSCMMTIESVQGADITTIEGLSEDGSHPDNRRGKRWTCPSAAIVSQVRL